ncbi:hypothetical protein [Peptostreptococcus faecalis]|uniref:hypothetical protein n=1 Tax=Peptostreptococcus faecalis TaxID=2045015 RepID=UPI000C7B914B|nr:hypothetical protein [Peptostreptococcus faecalis]
MIYALTISLIINVISLWFWFTYYSMSIGLMYNMQMKYGEWSDKELKDEIQKALNVGMKKNIEDFLKIKIK